MEQFSNSERLKISEFTKRDIKLIEKYHQLKHEYKIAVDKLLEMPNDQKEHIIIKIKQ